MVTLKKAIVLVPLMMLLASSAAQSRQTRLPSIPTGMVEIAQGEYAPLYKSPDGEDSIAVSAFLIDADPVTNQNFLDFVIQNPKWSKSQVSRIFADETYLRHWASDTDIGDAFPTSPVTNISWFAAKAYAKWKGNRLPSVAEWEYVAGAGLHSPDGKSEDGFTTHILNLTNRVTPNTPFLVGLTKPNYWGVRDLHGLVWEWTSDFNSALITGESRADANLERKLYCGSGVVGASDFTDYAAFMRFAFRGSLKAAYSGANLGFRTARSL
jgi:formylglycine-generating enzyme